MPFRRKECDNGAFLVPLTSSFCMAPVLEFLRILIRLARDVIKRFPGRGATLRVLAFRVLGRKLNLFWFGQFGRPKRAKPAERPSLGTQASSYSVSGGSAVAREYVIAASYVPASASHPSLHEHTEMQPPSPLYHLSESVVNRRSGSPSAASIESRASDTNSIKTNSLDSIHSTRGQPSQLPGGSHRQIGRGPNPSQSRERVTRPPAPTTRPNTPVRPPSITTNLPSLTHGEDRVDPVVQSPASAYTHGPRSLPYMRENSRRQSVVMAVDIQNLSTDSLPSINPPQITGEPFAMDSPTVQSPDSAVDVRLERHYEPSSPTPSNHPTLDLSMPESRSLQLIHSEQVPRYTKGVTM